MQKQELTGQAAHLENDLSMLLDVLTRNLSYTYFKNREFKGYAEYVERGNKTDCLKRNAFIQDYCDWVGKEYWKKEKGFKGPVGDVLADLATCVSQHSPEVCETDTFKKYIYYAGLYQRCDQQAERTLGLTKGWHDACYVIVNSKWKDTDFDQEVMLLIYDEQIEDLKNLLKEVEAGFEQIISTPKPRPNLLTRWFNPEPEMRLYEDLVDRLHDKVEEIIEFACDTSVSLDEKREFGLSDYPDDNAHFLAGLLMQ